MVDQQTKVLAKTLALRTIPVLESYRLGPSKVKKLGRGIRHITLSIRLSRTSDLEKITSAKFAESLAMACSLKNVSVFRDSGLVNLSFLLPSQYHKSCLYKDTTGRGFGMTDNDTQVEYNFDDSNPQILIAGASGSGKNYAASAMVLSISRTEPDTEFVFVDPMNQFYMFDNWIQLAQPLAQYPNGINRNIDYVFEEYTNRHGALPSEVEKMNRLVLVIDELEAKVQDSVALKKLNDISTGGRKYKVNMVALSQKPTEKKLGGFLHSLTQVYVGKVKDSRISSDLTGIKGLQAERLWGKGDFIQVLAEDITRFQVAEVKESDFDVLERGAKTYRVPNLPPEVNFNALEAGETPELIKGKTRGRPPRKLAPDVLAYFIANKGVSVRQAAESMGTNNASYTEYKDFAAVLESTLKNAYGLTLE